jgi:hypothetical protein
MIIKIGQIKLRKNNVASPFHARTGRGACPAAVGAISLHLHRIGKAFTARVYVMHADVTPITNVTYYDNYEGKEEINIT